MRLNTKINEIPCGTNILDIEVPEQLRKRVKSKLTYFDDALGGQGFTPSAVTLFTGTPGAGTSSHHDGRHDGYDVPEEHTSFERL